MTDDTPQTFKLTSAAGEVIMTGSMSAIMERLPDTRARDDALGSMLRTAIDAVEAEEKRQDAVRSCAQLLDAFADQMNARIDAYEAKCEAEAEAAAEEAEREAREEIQRTLDALPDPDDPEEREASLASDRTGRDHTDQDPEGIIPDPDDPLGTELMGDDGELTIKHEVDPEKYSTDQERPALSYSNVPMSYVKKKDEDLPPGHDPMPFDPAAPGAVDVPPLGPEPGSRLYEGPPQVPQPVSISLNEE
jgi:hypothetical protein